MKFSEQSLYHELKHQWYEAKRNKDWFLADQIKKRIRKLKKWQKFNSKKK